MLNFVFSHGNFYHHTTDENVVHLALQPSVVKRAPKYALVVGIVLILINHGDAILKGEVTHAQLLKMALTVLVLYVVSTLSSVGALRKQRRSVWRYKPPL